MINRIDAESIKIHQLNQEIGGMEEILENIKDVADAGTIQKIEEEIKKVKHQIEELEIQSKYKHIKAKRVTNNPCKRCHGYGVIARYQHVEGGKCYSCGGTGKA